MYSLLTLSMKILLNLTPGRCGPSSTQMTLKPGMLLSGIVVPRRKHKINKITHARLPKKNGEPGDGNSGRVAIWCVHSYKLVGNE